MKFYSSKEKSNDRHSGNTSSNNILDVIDFIKKSDITKPLKFSDGTFANYDSILKRLGDPPASVSVFQGDDHWTITTMP